MAYAKWAKKDELKKQLLLEEVGGELKIDSSGLPVMCDNKFLYVDKRINHSLVIGSSESGKTQAITLPMLRLAMLAGESVVVHDCSSELYETTKDDFLNYGYNVLKINFDDAQSSNHWNPLDLPHKLYMDGNLDKAQEMVWDLGFYLLNEVLDDKIDPFWINSAVDYFTGITLYAFENNDSVNLNIIGNIDRIVQADPLGFIEKIEKNSNIYINLFGVLNAPVDTRGGIFSMFNQKFKKYISKQNLSKMMSNSDFNVESIGNEKTIVYVISGNSNNSEHLLPLLISQIYFAKSEYFWLNSNRINMIIDDFYILYPIKNFAKVLNYSRSINIIFTIIIRGFNDLKNVYGKEGSEIIKVCFTNIMYLLSKDLNTLQEISNFCGNINDNGTIKPLITIEELKTLKMFEAIYITTRVMPYKTNLLPYFKIDKFVPLNSN